METGNILQVFCELTGRNRISERDRRAELDLEGVSIEAVRRGISISLQHAKASGRKVNGLRYCEAEIRKAARALASSNVGRAPAKGGPAPPPPAERPAETDPIDLRDVTRLPLDAIKTDPGVDYLPNRDLRILFTVANAWRFKLAGDVRINPPREKLYDTLLSWALEFGFPVAFVEQYYGRGLKRPDAAPARPTPQDPQLGDPALEYIEDRDERRLFTVAFTFRSRFLRQNAREATPAETRAYLLSWAIGAGIQPSYVDRYYPALASEPPSINREAS